MPSRWVTSAVRGSFGETELGFQTRVDRETVEHEFIDRLFAFWDTSYRGSLSFQVRWDEGKLWFDRADQSGSRISFRDWTE